jgi:hypothetical protein
VAEQHVAVELDRVPETLLWTLWHRALEARRPDAVLHDLRAAELVERIDFPFEERFGDGRVRWLTVDLPEVVELRDRPPPWHWSLDRDEERRLRALPGVAELRPLRLPRGRGAVHGYVLPLATMLPPVRRLLLTVLLVRFG